MIYFIVNDENFKYYEPIFEPLKEKYSVIYDIPYSHITGYTDISYKIKKMQTQYFNEIYKLHKEKIIYFYSTHLLHEYVTYKKIEQQSNINIANLITFIKCKVNFHYQLMKFIKELPYKVNLYKIKNFSFNEKNQKLLITRQLFKEIDIRTIFSIKKNKHSALNVQKIKNWEAIQNQLYNTNISRYLN